MSHLVRRPGTAVGDEQRVLQAFWSRKDILTLCVGPWVCAMLALFTVLSMGGSQVKKLYIQYNYLSTLRPGLLARAVNLLEEVWTGGTEFTVKHMEAILIGIGK